MDAFMFVWNHAALWWCIRLVFAACVAVLLRILVDLRWKAKKLPPGPWGLPVIGSVFWLGMQPHVSLARLATTYGDILSITFGSYTAIVLNSIGSVRETFGAQSDAYAGRPQLYSLTAVHEGLGVLFVDFGPKYRRQRKLVVRALHRNFYTSGKARQHLSEEIDVLARDFARCGRDSFDPRPKIRHFSMRAVLKSFFAQDPAHGEDSVEALAKRLVANVDKFEATASPINLSDIIPWLQYLPYTTNYTRIEAIFHEYVAIHETLFARTKDSRTSGAPRNLTDSLLDNLEKYNKGASSDEVDEKDLVYVLADLVAAAFDTVACTLNWAFFHMATHPEWQEKVHSELDSIIGRDHTPSPGDRHNLPITNATVHEVLRISPALPLTLPHMTTRRSQVRDYVIPEGTFVFMNLWAIHRDPTKWSEPEKFDPARFLTEEGVFAMPAHRSFLPFSTGTRSCMGERMAMDEVFLVFTTLMQRLRLQLACEDVDGSGDFTLTYKPKAYLITTEER